MFAVQRPLIEGCRKQLFRPYDAGAAATASSSARP